MKTSLAVLEAPSIYLHINVYKMPWLLLLSLIVSPASSKSSQGSRTTTTGILTDRWTSCVQGSNDMMGSTCCSSGWHSTCPLATDIPINCLPPIGGSPISDPSPDQATRAVMINARPTVPANPPESSRTPAPFSAANPQPQQWRD